MPAPEETIPKTGNGEWEQKGLTITAKGQGNLSAAQSSFNKNILPKRQAEFDALPADQKKGKARPTAIPITTSCNDVMSKIVGFWGSSKQMNVQTMVDADPAFYVKAPDAFAKSPPVLPKPGDIIYLVKEKSRGEFQHVCLLVSQSDDVWVTADGGGGALPDQTATVNNKPLSFTSNQPVVPMFASVTDGKTKAVHGWVDIDKLANPKYNADGSRK